ncbi:MAG: FimB/Mfa2 family fimbrial subunit [Bacteroidales bacterium]|nr:FimB/Mfa2 family fimbrial subunit [Bacteroidales bacterium]
MKILRGALALTYSALLTLGISGCKSMIYDDLDPCPQGVELRFVYDYNMEWANAFPSKVHCLTVLVYDKEGKFMEKHTNTNHLRIMLQQINGEPLQAADFGIKIKDDNTLFSYDNSIIPSHEITYLPWSLTEKPVGTNDKGEDWTTVIGELSTSRLISRNSRGGGAPAGLSSVDSPRLIITHSADDSVIADLPLVNYLLLFKSDRYADLPDQEFLDRMSEWNVILFLDQNLRWINTHIVVNDWVVRLNDAEF